VMVWFLSLILLGLFYVGCLVEFGLGVCVLFVGGVVVGYLLLLLGVFGWVSGFMVWGGVWG